MTWRIDYYNCLSALFSNLSLSCINMRSWEAFKHRGIIHQMLSREFWQNHLSWSPLWLKDSFIRCLAQWCQSGSLTHLFLLLWQCPSLSPWNRSWVDFIVRVMKNVFMAGQRRALVGFKPQTPVHEVVRADHIAKEQGSLGSQGTSWRHSDRNRQLPSFVSLILN